jgi:hypothetical protein
MHQFSALSVVLAGASVLSLASAQSSSQPEDGTVVLTSTAPGTTIVVTATSSTSSAASEPSEEADSFPGESSEEIAEYKRLSEACYPRSNAQIDWEAPCPAGQIIQAECTWGPDAGEKLRDMWTKSLNGDFEEPAGFSEEWVQQPLDVQRACLCSSSFAEMVLGCGACFEGHGASSSVLPSYWATSNATAVQEFTKLYCKADVEPTDEIGAKAFDILLGQSGDYFPGATSSSSSVSATTTASDRLGTSTDVSLYFTPTASSAWTVDMPTASSDASQTQHPNPWYTYTSLSTSDGLIVPTAFNAKRVTASPPSGSQSGAEATGSGASTATEAAGAMQTAMVRSGFGAGALGLAAVVLAL